MFRVTWGYHEIYNNQWPIGSEIKQLDQIEVKLKLLGGIQYIWKIKDKKEWVKKNEMEYRIRET